MTSSFYTSVIEHRGEILYRGYFNEKRISKRVKYKPYLFLEGGGEFKTIYGKPVRKRTFDNIWDAKNFVKETKEIHGSEIFGLTKFKYTYINDQFPEEMDFDIDLIRIANIDIECDTGNDGFPSPVLANERITAITVTSKNVIYSFGLVDFVTEDPRVKYQKFESEKRLLLEFLVFWEQMDFDVITGWNLEGFDIQYLVNRIKKVLSDDHALRLSPWRIVEEKKLHRTMKDETTYDIFGITVLDYLALYKKFVQNKQESYSLDYIAFAELGKRKLDYSEYASSLTELFLKHPQKYMEYNIRDTELVDELEEKLGFLSLAITFCFSAKINFSDIYTPTVFWDVKIHNYLLKRNIVIPPASRGKKTEQYEGAYVHNPIIGKHKHVVTFDLKSLYPSILVQNNMSPETYAGKYEERYNVDDLVEKFPEPLSEYLLENNYSFGCNSSLWNNKNRGLIAEILEDSLNQRDVYKDKMKEYKKQNEKEPSKKLKNLVSRYDKLQESTKLGNNSFYGVCGTASFRWFSIPYVEGITCTGQFVTKFVAKNLNLLIDNFTGVKKDRWVMSDTDSVFLTLEDVVEKLELTDPDQILKALDMFASKILQKAVDKTLEEVKNNLNSYKSFLSMKREKISDSMVICAKKNYFMSVVDNEGFRYKEPEIIMKGIKAVRSDTPATCRDSLRDSLKIFLSGNNDELITHVKEFRKKFDDFSFEEMASPSGVNGMKTYRSDNTVYTGGTPIHVRASLLYNNLLKEKKLTKKYQEIKDGDKMKYVYLKLPNPIKENVIGAFTTLPSEFDLVKYIDIEAQFEKAFLSPIKIIATAIGWQTEIKSTLEELM